VKRLAGPAKRALVAFLAALVLPAVPLDAQRSAPAKVPRLGLLHVRSARNWTTRIFLDELEQQATVVAINVGGALIPLVLSLYLVWRLRMYGRMRIGTAIVALVTHQLAEIVPGVGIAVPVFVPPLVAAGVALILAWRRAPPVAYVAGCMGTLIGADLWNLPNVATLGAPIVSIGGAGTFDGVFLTGIIAGLLV
jgi:uncharacterized membrane protein